MSQRKAKPVDEDMTPDTLLEYFAAVPDPRIDRCRLHRLDSILVMSLLAVICGADSFVGIEQFCLGRQAWLESFLDLPNGIPSHDTLGRVFALLNPIGLREAFRGWMESMAKMTNGGLIAIDGKTLRRSYRKPGVGFVHMVSAWSAQNRTVLAQVKTEEKSNEITAIPRLLELLNIRNCRVTIDAMGCQKDIAAKIVDRGGDYQLAVKENQPTLAADIEALFQEARSNPGILGTMDYTSTSEKAHGRREVRRCWTSGLVNRISQADQWKNLRSLALVESERTVNGVTTLEQRYYISSTADLTAALALADARSHWGIENQVHWILDVAFREDDCRVRVGHAAENFAVIRHLALNLLKSAEGPKVGIQNRRLRATNDDAFLMQVLAAGS